MFMVNALIFNVYAFVYVNGVFQDKIMLHKLIRQGCALAPYLYVLVVDALGYLLEVARI
jgi:hypothetical protein